MMTLNEAVRYLREHLSLTQEQFARELGKHTTTVVRYEGSRPPTGSVLMVLAKLAEDNNAPDLARTFQCGFNFERGSPTPEDLAVRLNNGHVTDDSEELKYAAAAYRLLKAKRTNATDYSISILRAVLGPYL